MPGIAVAELVRVRCPRILTNSATDARWQVSGAAAAECSLRFRLGLLNTRRRAHFRLAIHKPLAIQSRQGDPCDIFFVVVPCWHFSLLVPVMGFPPEEIHPMKRNKRR